MSAATLVLAFLLVAHFGGLLLIIWIDPAGVRRVR